MGILVTNIFTWDRCGHI